MSNEFSTDDYLPDWTTSRFAVLDPSARWASCLHREVVDRLQSSANAIGVDAGSLEFESCATARDAMLLCELNHTVALIMFATGVERDCLSLLGGLARRHRSLPTLIVAADVHEDLLPALYEAGATTVLFDVKDDVAVARWCLRVMSKRTGR